MGCFPSGQRFYLWYSGLEFCSLCSSTFTNTSQSSRETNIEREYQHHTPLIFLNMKSIISQWVPIFALLSTMHTHHVAADATTSPSYSCVPGSQVTALPNCDNFLGFFNTCPNLPSKQEAKSCFCVQDSLNALFGYDLPSPCNK
jgi:hypothetical protein